MAGLLFRATPGDVSLSAATAKTVLQIIAPTNQRVLIRSLRVTFAGTNPVAAPATVRVLRQTTAGTVTSLTLVKDNNSDDETIQSTAGYNATAEPTASDVLETYRCHTQSGLIIDFPWNSPLIAKGGSRIGIEITSAEAVTCNICAKCEE